MEVEKSWRDEMKEWLKRWGVKMGVSSAHYPQSNSRAEYAVKAANKLAYRNTMSSGALDMDKFLQATITYRNSTIYPETSKMISQSLLGRHFCLGQKNELV